MAGGADTREGTAGVAEDKNGGIDQVRPPGGGCSIGEEVEDVVLGGGDVIAPTEDRVTRDDAGVGGAGAVLEPADGRHVAAVFAIAVPDDDGTERLCDPLRHEDRGVGGLVADGIAHAQGHRSVEVVDLGVEGKAGREKQKDGCGKSLKAYGCFLGPRAGVRVPWGDGSPGFSGAGNE